MERDLATTAKYLGTTRLKLIKLMREKGVLNERNLPTFPTRDRNYLRIKDSNWFHDKLGMQYSQSTRVTQAGINWLAAQLGIELPPPPEDLRHVA